MSLRDWYAGRELLLTGVTSELGRNLLEKILRCLPDVKVYVVLRSRNGLDKNDRIKKIFASPGYERLRQEQPDALSRVHACEGNLLYDDLCLGKADKQRMSDVSVAFHAAGPHDAMFEFCHDLPRLQALAAASSLFRHRGQIPESVQNERVPHMPLALVRLPVLGPARQDPMPGLVEIVKGPTALMVGAGFALGNSQLQAELTPVDVAANTLIATAWERANRPRSDGVVVYNAATIGCTWGDLIRKGQRASRKFAYPTFGIRGMTSLGWLHWICVLLLEWLPSALCDTLLGLCGGKPRMLPEYRRVREALRALEPIATRPWSAERSRVHQLQERLSPLDKEAFPVAVEIDVESYVLCAAAATRKYCVDEGNVAVVKTFRAALAALVMAALAYALLSSRRI